MKLIKQLVFVLFVVQSMLSATGCSAVGFGIGALSDSNKIEKLEISSEDVSALPKSSHIQILLKNGQQQEGQFQLYIAQKVGDEYLGNIVWHDKANNRQVSTQIAEIDRIVTKQQRNGKWLGLLLGGIIDAIIIVGIYKMDRFFEGLSFLNYP